MSLVDKAGKVKVLMEKCLIPHLDGAEGAVVVEGIRHKFAFAPEKIQTHRAEIKALLDEMPEEFHLSGGGGWSFLNLCMDKHGEQWGEHHTMESLIALGQAAGMAHYQLPRDMWEALPGGMPYVAFDTTVG